MSTNKQYKNSRYKKIISLINENSSSVLDVGCGEGYLEKMLDNLNYVVTGFDISKKCIVQAQKNFPRSIYFIGDGCKRFKYEDNNFNIVVCNGVLEHVEKPSNVVKECLRVCKGICIIGTSNAWHFDLYFNTQKHSLSECVYQYFSPNVLRGLIKKYGGIVDYINLSAFIPPFNYIFVRCYKENKK